MTINRLFFSLILLRAACFTWGEKKTDTLGLFRCRVLTRASQADCSNLTREANMVLVMQAVCS